MVVIYCLTTKQQRYLAITIKVLTFNVLKTTAFTTSQARVISLFVEIVAFTWFFLFSMKKYYCTGCIKKKLHTV